MVKEQTTKIKRVNITYGDANDYCLHDYLMCMATVGCFKSDNKQYHVYVHGNIYDGKVSIPHMHIISFHGQPYNVNIKLDMELSLVDIICHDEYKILSLKVDETIVKANTDDWPPYNKLKEDLTSFIETGPVNYLGAMMIDNLHRAIWLWNEEQDFEQGHKGINILSEFIQSRGIKPLEKYESHLRDWV